MRRPSRRSSIHLRRRRRSYIRPRLRRRSFTRLRRHPLLSFMRLRRRLPSFTRRRRRLPSFVRRRQSFGRRQRRGMRRPAVRPACRHALSSESKGDVRRGRDAAALHGLSEVARAQGKDGTGRLFFLLSPVTEKGASEKNRSARSGAAARSSRISTLSRRPLRAFRTPNSNAGEAPGASRDVRGTTASVWRGRCSAASQIVR
jgi:hypothetical protein